MERRCDIYLAYLPVNSTWSIFSKISSTHTCAIPHKPVCPSSLANIPCVQHWFQCNILYLSLSRITAEVTLVTALSLAVAYFSLYKSWDRLLFAGHFSLFIWNMFVFPSWDHRKEKSHRWYSATLSLSCCQQKTLFWVFIYAEGQALWSWHKSYVLQCYY